MLLTVESHVKGLIALIVANTTYPALTSATNPFRFCVSLPRSILYSRNIFFLLWSGYSFDMKNIFFLLRSGYSIRFIVDGPATLLAASVDFIVLGGAPLSAPSASATGSFVSCFQGLTLFPLFRCVLFSVTVPRISRRTLIKFSWMLFSDELVSSATSALFGPSDIFFKTWWASKGHRPVALNPGSKFLETFECILVQSLLKRIEKCSFRMLVLFLPFFLHKFKVCLHFFFTGPKTSSSEFCIRWVLFGEIGLKFILCSFQDCITAGEKWELSPATTTKPERTKSRIKSCRTIHWDCRHNQFMQNLHSSILHRNNWLARDYW